MWVTFPGGGVYPWVWIPAACAVLALAAVTRPVVKTRDDIRAIDRTLLLAGLAIGLQLVPIPYSLLQAVDPHAMGLRAALWLMPQSDPAERAQIPISIVPLDTVAAFGIFACAALVYWTCRQICEAGGTGRVVRAVSAIGLVASLAAIVQPATGQGLLYGIWQPLDSGARPFGPFVNRNHFATWVIMAWPLVFGYLLARAPQRPPHALSQRVASALKQLGSTRIWLVASLCLMALAVLISTSRSGIIGLIGSFAASVWLSRERLGPAVWRWTIFQAAVLALAAVSFANFDALEARLDETLTPSAAGRGRRAIWADARRVVEDFPLTGTGAGTFGSAVAVYQTAEPGYAIGQAHNHYLQLAAEGGALLVVPAVLTAGAFFWLCRRRFEEDSGPDYLIRAGAVAGVFAVLLQSGWETGLRMPANAILLAVLAAIATHAPPSESARQNASPARPWRSSQSI